MGQTLRVIGDGYSICRLSPNSPIPEWIYQSPFYSISKTTDERSVVCQASLVPIEVQQEKGWSLIKVEGPLDFSLTGILASLTKPLAEAKISLFSISTFDTDYILVKEDRLTDARQALEAQGFTFRMALGEQ